ncbi:hypothetical protein AMECASPLE_019003 [Ameca splendens]|uniref:Uncharacterized protein n=1 Tax=Ameca splendens TaxID=208324 RepID=A0ABV1A9A3_9TELE
MLQSAPGSCSSTTICFFIKSHQIILTQVISTYKENKCTNNIMDKIWEGHREKKLLNTPQNLSTLHRSQATQLRHRTTTHYCTVLVWKPSYSPHCVRFLVSLNPSPSNRKLIQPSKEMLIH